MQEIYQKLRAARTRLRLVVAARYVGLGLLAGSLAAVILALAASLLGVAGLMVCGWGAFVFGLVGGCVYAYVNAPTWRDAARAVDRHFRLDDRTQSAIAFLEEGKSGGLYTLQVNDTAARLTDVDTSRAVSIKPPRALAIGMGWAAVAAILLMFLPMADTRHSTVPQVSNDSNAPRKSTPTPSDSNTSDSTATWQAADNREVLYPKVEVTEHLETDFE
ncbi:MAG: hypothetical protein MI757_01135, partial [Pirellulales bacterium]|nr:hypothetical protein [Pirellulales bacterium]